MKEQPKGFEPDNPILLSTQYGQMSPNVARRWRVYRHAENYIDHDKVFEELNLRGDECVLDIGCGDAEWLRYLASERGHHGPLLAMDIHPELLAWTRYDTEHEEGQPIDFAAGEVEALPLADNSIDVALAMFMLYHAKDIDRGLAELQRVVKPGGQIVVATSGANNKLRHREFERLIAAYLSVSPPPVFAARFNSEAAERRLPVWFEIEKRLSQSGALRVESAISLQDYLSSLASMREAFSPEPLPWRWQQALEKVVVPRMHQEFHDNGIFVDTVQRDFFICRNQAQSTEGGPLIL